MPAKKHTLGAIGLGVIWEAAHWPAIRSIAEQAQLKYVYDVNRDLSRKAAEQTGAKALECAEEMFRDPEVDVIAICTPPFARVDYVERACGTGKHLMLEKPMARTVKDALRICRAIRTNHTKCFIPFGRAVHADWRRGAQIAQSGELGKPVAFHHINLTTPYFWIPLDHWMHDQVLSGGPIFDYSIHFLEMARACMGEAESVYYGAAAPTGRVKSDDTAVMLVYYEGGTLGEFSKTWNFPPGVKFGENANLLVCQEGVVSFGAGPTQIHTPEGTRTEESLQKNPLDGRIEAYKNLFAAIDEGESLHADETNGLRMTEILEAALLSRQSGKRERITLHT